MIITITSVHEDIPRAGAAGYCASKGARRNLTRRLALELAKDKINVNNIAPGMIATAAGQPVTAMVNEGEFPGPTLRLRTNETLRLKLINGLDDHTNIHTHGFHVSPKDNSDNIFVQVDPGTEFDYEYLIPDDHPAGTYWYHPHAHGNTAVQTNGGMGGVIIIEGDLDAVEGIAGLVERTLVLSATQFDGDGAIVDYNSQTP